MMAKTRKRTTQALNTMRNKGEAILSSQGDLHSRRTVDFKVIQGAELRQLFDDALDLVHYAKSCQRVGRCMRLAIVSEENWVGGIVLGSTFPNIATRDQALGLKKYVIGFQSRGLRNPWSRTNTLYWQALQTIVNHARTFIFPEFQGCGLGKSAHRLLLSRGIKLWEQKYSHKVYALDTLCDQSDSGLFLANGWSHVGQTKGYTADYQRPFSSKRAAPSINNAALRPGPRRWEVWVRTIRESLSPRHIEN